MYFICNFCDTLENYFEKLTTARKCAREVVLAALKVPRHLYLSHWLLDTFEKKLPGALVRLRKFKCCQNYLELHLWLPNYVVLTVRTEKPPKNLFNQLRQGGTTQKGHFTT